MAFSVYVLRVVCLPVVFHDCRDGSLLECNYTVQKCLMLVQRIHHVAA